MQTHISTTPFGRRPVSLGQIAAQMQAGRAIEAAGKLGSNQPAAVNKWALFRTLTQVKERLGVSDRTLSVLNALLSFQQETALSLPWPCAAGGRRAGEGANRAGQGGAEEAAEAAAGGGCDLVVFPSNRALCLRAHGMAETTLRRHLAALVEAGLIIRRDSPNGKRYARKDVSGAARFSDAFGFDLTPLVTRADEFEAMAEELRREARALRLLKERISLCRRDVAKLIACGLDEGFEGPWEAFRQRFMGLATPLRRIKAGGQFEALAGELAKLRGNVAKTLESHINSQNTDANDNHIERHESNTNTQYPTELEPASNKDRVKVDAKTAERKTADAKTGLQGENTGENSPAARQTWPLGMVLEACPDVRDYAPGGSIRSWPEFLAGVRLLRPMLGISPDAWREAVAVLGEPDAAIAVAAILQRSEHSSEAVRGPREAPGKTPDQPAIAVNGSPAVKSPGGYLRALTEKARAGEFALGPLLMALSRQRLKARRAAVR